MPTSNEKFASSGSGKSTGGSGGAPTSSERHEHEGRTPQPGVPAGPRDTQYPSNSGYEYPDKVYEETGLAPPPGRTAQETKEIGRREKQKARQKRRKSRARVTSIEDKLNFSRDTRAKSYETDKFNEIATKYFERNPDGSLKMHHVSVPVVKTSEDKIKEDERHYRKVIRSQAISGASPQAIKLLNKAAAAKVIEDNYVTGKRGKVATEQHKVPTIKPGRLHDFQQEVQDAQEKTHEIKEGHKSYYFQSKTSKAYEADLQRKLDKNKDDGGLLGGIPVVGDIANDPVGSLYQVVAPVPTLIAKKAGVNFTSTDEKVLSGATRGISELAKVMSNNPQQQMQDAYLEQSGIPILSDVPALRRNVVHGLHTGVQTGAEYLTRPGLVIEQGIGLGVGAGGDPWEAVLHGHKGKNVIFGKDIAEKLTGKPQGGLLIDFATDPTLWVGAGEIKLVTGERLVSLSDRIARVNPELLNDSVTAKLLKDADNRGDPEVVLNHLEDLAEKNGISLSKLGKSKFDREAIAGWRDRLAKKQEARVARDSKARAENKYFMGGKSRREAVQEAGRAAKEAKSEPGIRLKIQTPLGKDLSSIDIKLPKKFATEHKIIPDLHASPAMRKENYKDLLNLRRNTIDKEVLKGFDSDLADASKALKEAKSPEARRVAEERMTELRRRLDDARTEAKSSIDTTKLRSPAEHAAQRSSRRLAHELNRVASANARSVFHRSFANMEDAMKGLNEKERQQVGLHMAEYADTGGRDTADSIAPLNDQQRIALENMKSVNYELGRYGLETGTIDQLTKDYAFRHVVKGSNPLGKGAEDTAAERASTMKAASNPSKSRGYAASAEVSGRGHLATQLQDLSHGSLTREEALKLADNWHDRGKVRAIQEDLAHAVQRGKNPKETDLTNLEREAYEWGRGRQKVNGEKIPDLFKDLESTEGQLKLTPDAHKVHNFEENPFGSLTNRDALALKHATAQGSLERLRQMRASVERPEVQNDLDRIIARREAEVKGYKEVRNPQRKSVTKVNKKIAKVEALRDRPGTPGEGAAAQRMLDGLKKTRDERLGAKDDFGDFIPQTASKDYLGSLKDFRDEHPEQFTVLDPKLANYHRSLRESVKSAYTLRWKAADKSFGRAADDSRLRSPDGKLFYDKKTGAEYIYADPSVFKQAIPEGRVIPVQLHADLKSEFFRMGENVAHDLFDDASAGLFGKLSSMTRFSLTTYFPAYHMRNMISDTMNSLLADPGVMFHPVVNGKLAEGAMSAGKGFAKKVDVPGFDHAINTEDYLFMMETLGLKSQEHIAEFVAAAEKGQLADRPWWKKGGLGRSGKGGEFALRMSARREDIVRMQTFLQRMRRNGGDAADAAWHTIKYHFDYADLSQWEKRYMRNAFLFYTWYRKNIPLQFLSMIQKPGFFSALTNSYIELAEGGTPFNVNWNSINPLLPDLSGPVPNSSLIPGYMTTTMAAPVVNWNGHAVALSMGLPWADMNLVTNALEKPEEGIRQFFNMLIPPARLGAELGFSQSLLTGQKLEGYENTTWSNLMGMMGAKLPEDDEGKPLLPWQVGVIMNNIFPAVGRGAGYLKPPSSVEDQGTFSSLFGGGAGTFLTGVSAYVGPKSGERLDKAYIYKVYERAQQREVVMNSGKKDKQRDDDVAKFDEQTKEWALANGVPDKYMHVVQGLGPKWFISKSDRKAATEIGLLDSEEGGIDSTIGTKGLFSTDSGAGSLEPDSYEAPAKKYKSRTEEALDLLGPTKQQGFFTLGEGTSRPEEGQVASSLYNLRANQRVERKLAAGPSAADRRMHEGKSPEKLPGLKTPKTKGQGKEADVQKAQASVGNFLGKNKLGKGPNAKEHEPPKKVKVAAIEGLPDDPSTRFAEALAHYSGMSPQVAGAWTLSEMGGEASGGGAGEYNYLGVGFPGEKTELSEEVPSDSPEAAAKFTAEWLSGKYSGSHPAVTGIQEILGKSNGGKNLNAFANALGESGWGTDPGHVLENAGSVKVNGKTEMTPGAKDFKLVTSRQQARTVIHLANKFAGTQEGTALQQHWASMAGISSSEAWCSAFISTLMRRVGLPEPDAPAAAGTWQQWKGGKRLDTTDLNVAKPGDILMFGSSDPSGTYADHVGLYLGDGEMISGNFGDEVRRGPISEESRPIQSIVRPHYSGKEVQFKLSTNPLSSGGGAVSGAATASGGPSSGAAAQSTPGYHPGRTKQAQITAAQMRNNVMGGIGKSSSIKSLLTATELGNLGPDAAKLFKLSAKVKAEIESDTADNTSLTARTKRKPKLKLVK